MRMPPSNHAGSTGTGPTINRRYAGSDSFRTRLRNNSVAGSTTTTSSSSATTRLQQKLENAGNNEFVGKDENYVSSSESGSSGGSDSASSTISMMNTTAMPNKAPSKVLDADNNMGGVDSFVTALKKRQNSRSPVRDRVGEGGSNNTHHMRRGWQHTSPATKGNNISANNGQVPTKEVVREEKEGEVEEEGENEENQTTNTTDMGKNLNSTKNHGGGRHRHRVSRNLRINSNDAGISSSRPTKHNDSEAGGVLSPRKNASMATGILSPRNKKNSMMLSGSSAPLRSPYNAKKANQNDALLSPRQNKMESTAHVDRQSTAVAMSTVLSSPKMKARSSFNNDAKSANKASSTTVVENVVASPREQKAYLFAQRRLHRGSSAIFKNPGKQPKSSVVDAVLEKDKVRAEKGGASPPPVALNDTHRLGSLDKPIDIVGSPGASSLWKPKKAPQSSSAAATAARLNGKSVATANGASARSEIPLGRSSRRNGIKHVVRTFPKKETNNEEKKKNLDCTTKTVTEKEETTPKDDHRPLSKLKDSDSQKEGDAKKDADKDGMHKKDTSSSPSSPLWKQPKSDFQSRFKPLNSTTSRVSHAKKASPSSFHLSSPTHHAVDTNDNDDSTSNNRAITPRSPASNTRRQMFEMRRQWAGTLGGLPATAPKKERDEETKPVRGRLKPLVVGGATQVDEEASTAAPVPVVGIEEGKEGVVAGDAPITPAAKTTAGEVEENPTLAQLMDAIRDAEIEMGIVERINDGEEDPSSENKMETTKPAVLPDVTSPSDVSPSACDDDDASKDEKDAAVPSDNSNVNHDSVVPPNENKTESTKTSCIFAELSTIKPSQMLNQKRKKKMLEIRRQSHGLISPSAQATRLQPAFSGEVAATDDDKEGEENEPTSNAALQDKNGKPSSANDDESKAQKANTAEETNHSPLANASSSSLLSEDEDETRTKSLLPTVQPCALALDLYKRSKAMANDAKKSSDALPREISMPSPRTKTTKKNNTTLYGDDGFPVDDADVVGLITLGRTNCVDTTSPMMMGDEKEEKDKRPSLLPKEIDSSSSSHPTMPKAGNDCASFEDDDDRLASSNNATGSGEDAFQPKERTKSMSSPMADDKVLAVFRGSSTFGDNASGDGSSSATSAATTTDAYDQAFESNVFDKSASGEEEDDVDAALYDCDAESVGDGTDVASSSNSRNGEAPSSAWSTARCDFGVPAALSLSIAAKEIAASIKIESFQDGLDKEQRAAFSEIIADHEAKTRKLEEKNRSKTAEVDFLKCEMTNQHEQILMLLDRAKKDKEDFAAKAAANAEDAEVAELKRELEDLRARLDASEAQDQEKSNKKSKKGKLNKVLRIKFPSSK